MSYVPPRGPCAQRVSIVSTCACFRFMVHPLKAATSFDCDGCGHHASFHKMDNERDDEVVRRWEQTRMADESDGNATTNMALTRPLSPDVQQAAPKRRRIMEKGQSGRSVLKPQYMNRIREMETREILE